MQKHLKLLAGAVLAAGLMTPVFAQDTEEPNASTVVATVNGTEITLGHMIAAMATLPQEYQQYPLDTLYNGILEQLVQQTVLAQTYTEALPPRVKLSLENEERSLRAGEAIEDLLADAVTEEDIAAAYEEQFADFEAVEEYNASHILVESQEEATALKEQLDGGADFAELAKEKSVGPTGPNGGNLGWFGTGRMVPAFEAATIALEVGAVSDPVETQFGWHVIKLNETRKSEPPALEDVRGQIENMLRRQEVQDILTASTEDADISVPEGLEIDPALLRNLELLD